MTATQHCNSSLTDEGYGGLGTRCGQYRKCRTFTPLTFNLPSLADMTKCFPAAVSGARGRGVHLPSTAAS